LKGNISLDLNPESSSELECLLQPEDWDDEADGEWEAPLIPNPEFKGPWTQKVSIPSLL